jgi:hypothetical protein
MIQVGSMADEAAAPGALRIDDSGRLFLAGRAQGQVDWSGGLGTGLVGGPGSGIVVASYSLDLDFRWGFRIDSDGGNDGAHRVVPDKTGGVFVAGWFNGTSDFDPGQGTSNLVNASGTTGLDMFVAKYSDGGTKATLDWVSGLISPVMHDDNNIIAGLAVDGKGRAWSGGQFFGTTDFDPGSGSLPMTTAGSNDAFVVRMQSVDGSIF